MFVSEFLSLHKYVYHCNVLIYLIYMFSKLSFKSLLLLVLMFYVHEFLRAFIPFKILKTSHDVFTV